MQLVVSHLREPNTEILEADFYPSNARVLAELVLVPDGELDVPGEGLCGGVGEGGVVGGRARGAHHSRLPLLDQLTASLQVHLHERICGRELS